MNVSRYLQKQNFVLEKSTFSQLKISKSFIHFIQSLMAMVLLLVYFATLQMDMTFLATVLFHPIQMFILIIIIITVVHLTHLVTFCDHYFAQKQIK